MRKTARPAVEYPSLPHFELKGGRRVKLGRVIPKAKPMALRLANYLDMEKVRANPPPEEVRYSAKCMDSLRRMYLNDREGDCVVASFMHQMGLWSGNDADSGGLVQATDQEVHAQYHEIGGPGDNGLVITDFMDVARSKGIRAGGKTYKIDGYVAVGNSDPLRTKVAHYLFGGLKLGVNLPADWLNSDEGGVWDVTRSRIVGGHDVLVVDYDREGVTVSTWGGLRKITWRAYTDRIWVTETYALLAHLWYGNDELAPSGVKVGQLQADMEKLSGGDIPDPGPVVPPGPDPGPPVPPPGPGPVPALFHLGFGKDVPKGKRITFRAPVDVRAGRYDVTPAAGKRATAPEAEAGK